MIWIKAKSGRLRVDEAAVKARVDHGWKLVLLVTVILLSEPIVVFIGAPGEGVGGRGVVVLGHALAALFLTFLLWTGVPMLRWIGALALINHIIGQGEKKQQSFLRQSDARSKELVNNRHLTCVVHVKNVGLTSFWVDLRFLRFRKDYGFDFCKN